MHKSGSIVILAALAIASAGCKKSEPAAEATMEATPSEMAAMPVATATPGTYDVMSSDGKARGTTTINADGTYRDVPAKGLAEAGIVKFTDGKTCFDPSGSKGPECWTESARAADGSFDATNEKGETVKVKPQVK